MQQLMTMIAFISARLDLRDAKDRGATATEYAMLVAFVAVIIAAGAYIFGGDISNWFSSLGDSVQNTPTK